MKCDSPHADRAVLLGFVVDQYDKLPRTAELTWGQIVEHFLTNHEESPCVLPGSGLDASVGAECEGAKCVWKSHSCMPKKPMAIVPGVVDGYQIDKNVRALTLLVLDFDHLSGDEAARVEAALAQAGVERAIYTTHNHRPPDNIAFRVVVLLSRAVAADQWHRFLPAAIQHLGVTIERVNDAGKVERQPDPVCKNRSRLYYLPSHPQGAHFASVHVAGIPLDVDQVLLAAAQAPAPLFDGDSDDVFDRAPLPSEVAWVEADCRAIAEAASAVFPARRRNEFCLALAGMLRRAGCARDAARWIVYETARAGGSDDPEARARVVGHTYEQDADAPLTGFSRLAEIIGEPAAFALGDLVSDARTNALLGDIDETPSFSPGPAISPLPMQADGHANGHANGHTVSEAPALPLPAAPVAGAPAAALDVAEARQSLISAANSKSRSLDRDDLVTAVLLRRVLHGSAVGHAVDLLHPEIDPDPETILAGQSRGLSPEAAVRRVIGEIARVLPAACPFDLPRELLRASLAATPEAPAGGWLEAARSHYRRADRARRLRDLESAQADERFKAAVFSYQPPPIPPQDIALSPVSDSPPPIPTDPDKWRDKIKKRGDGTPTPIPHNARVILENDPLFVGAIGWNEVSKRVEVRRGDGPLGAYVGALPIESIATGIQDILSAGYDLALSYQDVARRIIAVSRMRPFDPLADYLRSLRWDGTLRAGGVNTPGWLTTYCGAPDTPYVREVSRRWLIALVARGIKPGTKVDNVLVLEGKMGLGKSSAFEILGGEFFCDTALELGNKDSQMLAGRYWICELAELVSIRKTGQSAQKHFFSSRIDKFRSPYAASIEEAPRRCLFVGTMNPADDGVASYLTDETGNRKYWCVPVSFVEEGLSRLRQDRGQLLAEAVALYQGSATCPACAAEHERCLLHRWWFSYREIHVTEEEADKRMVESPARLKVESWWYSMEPSERPTGFTTLDVAEAALDKKAGDIRDGDLMSIGHALAKMKNADETPGFRIERDRTGARARRYYPSQEIKNAPRVSTMGRSRGSLFALPALPQTPPQVMPPTPPTPIGAH